MTSTDRWEWRDEPPTIEDVIKSLESLPPVWGVNTVDFASFVLPLTRNEKTQQGGREVWVPVTKLYMQVAGRVKMLQEAQEDLGWYVAERWEIVHTDPIVLMAEISIEGLGSRVGTAQLGKGSTPFEKMETAARGRALGAWGFGVLPGSGIASLEEIELAGVRDVDLTPESRAMKDRAKPEVIEEVRDTLEELRQVRDQDREELITSVGEWVKKTWNREIVEDDDIDWEKMTKGQLLLIHSNLKRQIDKEVSRESEPGEAGGGSDETA